MNTSVSARDKFLSYNTLVSLIQVVEGYQTTVDLRNGNSATGKIEQCDSSMNILMSKVLFRDQSGSPHIFESFFIHSRNIRYVHIPPQINMRNALQKHFESMFSHKMQPRKQGALKTSSLLRRQEETLKHVQNLKEHK